MGRYGFWVRMLDMLTSAYVRSDIRSAKNGSPPETNIGRLFYLIADGFEAVFENAERVKEWDDLDNAQGVVLDRYGANFGVARGSASDALYRIFIKVKMISQLSGGDNDAIINAAAELLGVEYSDILIEDVWPAKIAIYVDQNLLSEERLDLIDQIAYAIKRALVAGVGIRLYLRTYRIYQHDLLLRHGGAIMTRFQYAPISQDREEVWGVSMAHGGAAATDFSYTPIGEDRSHLQPLLVTYGGVAGTEFSYLPAGKDRLAKAGLAVGRAGLLRPEFEPPPVSWDRAAESVVTLGRAAKTGAGFDLQPTGEDRTIHSPLYMAHGGVLQPSHAGGIPAAKRSSTSRKGGAGGAYTRTHIKPKRIE